VRHTLRLLTERSSLIAGRIASGRLAVVGAGEDALGLLAAGDRDVTAAELFAWCYARRVERKRIRLSARADDETFLHRRNAYRQIRRVASKMAVRVGRIYPDGNVWWTNSGGDYTSLAGAYAGLPATTPVFGTATHRHQNDLISEFDPFATDIILGGDYTTQITTPYTPTLASGSIPSGKGIAIPGITDGFTGTAPDMGAIITGRGAPVWGDRTNGGGPTDTVPPAPPANLQAR
jgi:hypothetical protein